MSSQRVQCKPTNVHILISIDLALNTLLGAKKEQKGAMGQGPAPKSPTMERM